MRVPLPIGAEWCTACDGEGEELVSEPSFDDPYYQRRTGDPCGECHGDGFLLRDPEEE